MRGARAAAGVALALALAGCVGSVRETTTSRSSEEQLLVSSGAERAIARVDLKVLSGRRVFVDDSRLESVDRGYVASAFFDLCSESGALLVRDREKSDVVIEVRSACVGIYDAHWTIGIPGLYIMGLVDSSLGGKAGGGSTGSSSSSSSTTTSPTKGAAGAKGTNATGKTSASPSAPAKQGPTAPPPTGVETGTGGGVSTEPLAPGAARPGLPFTGGSQSSGNVGGASVESGGAAPAASPTIPTYRASGVVLGGEAVQRSPAWTGKPDAPKGELDGGGAPTDTQGPAGGEDPTFIEIGYELREGWARIQCFAYERETGVFLFGRHAWGYAHRGLFEDLHPPKTLKETAKDYLK